MILNRNLIKTMVFGLTFLALLSASVIAQDSPEVLGTTIPGVDIIVKKKPGGIVATTTTDSSGNYSFTLPPGDYTLQIGSANSTKDSGNNLKKNTKSHGIDNANRKAMPAQPDKKTNWISVEGSLYKFSIEGEGLIIGEATLLEDTPATGQDASVRTIRGIELGYAIKDKGVQRRATVKISGKVVFAK